MSTFLTADCHFFHGAMLKFCPDTRPYANISEMNDAMASAWRKVVKPNDEVIVVGDFAHRADDPKELKRLFDSLPGEKHLIVGNHDGPDTLALPWKTINQMAFLSIDSQRVVLCHYALRSWPGIRRGAWMLYGHHHGRLPGNSQSMDIGVDVMGLAPVRLNQIKQRLAQLPPLLDPEGGNDFENDGVKP
ncbi:metallophosphoesterase [Bradyrhizobium sp. CCBAU 45384]|uniref:metallophosphoesterase n=1 Tax=Bradyrhizobium sp. CCBAU 45384 TaxID=858428 RepID=UPI00230627E6|nr:metallophosphoesterase [Bradyrhizobium sp. CCBAU 45384]MDA9411881.1 hypothetical protein [Bradyrhizobium sp. CCBAU 45384]